MPADRPDRLELADLLGRATSIHSVDELSECLGGRRYLVTGAGGFLGSALARVLARLDDASVVLVENHENSLAALRKVVGGERVHFELADIRDARRMEHLIRQHRPQTVFHLAAYKHIDLAECFPEEYLAANVVATGRLAQAAINAGVERFIYPSSDKAVQPCSVYGATKRVTEVLLRSLGASQPATRFTVTRLVNVLGASGGVIETFIRQIGAGQCLTLTHPDMTRYWMTEAEALWLLAYGAASADPADIVAFDVGDAVEVRLVAERLWQRYGSPGRRLDVRYIGTRPGERLAELLLLPTEVYEPTDQEGVLRIRETVHPPLSLPALLTRLQNWECLAREGRRAELKEQLFGLVSEEMCRAGGGMEPDVRH